MLDKRSTGQGHPWPSFCFSQADFFFFPRQMPVPLKRHLRRECWLWVSTSFFLEGALSEGEGALSKGSLLALVVEILNLKPQSIKRLITFHTDHKARRKLPEDGQTFQMAMCVCVLKIKCHPRGGSR